MTSAPSSVKASTSDDYAVFSDALQHFAKTQHDVTASLQSSQHALDQHFAAHDSHLKQCKAQWAEYTRLQAMQRELSSAMSREEKSAMRPRMEEDHILLEMAKQELDQWRQAKPGNQNSWFLRLVLGRVNYQLWKKADKLEFKDAYNKFKRDTTVLFILFPLVQLLFPPQRVLFQLHQLWLLYYYFTLSLRENILYANGSSMKKWWLYHHYVSISITLLILLYPDDFCHPNRHTRLMLFGLAQGAVMLCQYLYQAKRSYVRKTLGKARSIDVDTTETLVEKPTDLQWLVPLLYALYLYEGYIGLSTLARFLHEEEDTWTVGVVRWHGRPWHLVWIGLGCLTLAVGNTITTSLVLVSKQKLRTWTKMVRNRQRSKPLAAPPNGPQERDAHTERTEPREAAAQQKAAPAKAEISEAKGGREEAEEPSAEDDGRKKKLTRRKK